MSGGNNAPRNPQNRPSRPNGGDGRNGQPNPKRPNGKRPEPKTPRAVIVIYVIMAVLILGICGVVFAITLKKTGDTNTSQTSSVVSSENGSTSGNTSVSTDTSSDNISEPANSGNTSSEGASTGEPAQSTGGNSEVTPPVSSDKLAVMGVNMVYVGEVFSYSCTVTGNVSKTPEIVWECVGDSGEITEGGRFTATKKGEVTLIAKDTANNLTGKMLVHVVNSASEVDFVPMVNNVPIVNKTYALPADYAPGGLTAETDAAFKKLVSGAAADGLNIYMISGYRSYEKQQKTYLGWCNTYGQKEADRISARPGFSEHQLGMAIDVNSLEESFENTAEGQWLAEHCWEYGFIIRYPKGKEEITGYSFEPWHIRYLGKELAKDVYESGLTLEEYFGIDSSYR
ncbi:MAG: D-alanyl-D-alanine carboxypeptidase family protein [Oscillospiraceae bacterium]